MKDYLVNYLYYSSNGDAPDKQQNVVSAKTEKEAIQKTKIPFKNNAIEILSVIEL